MAFRWKTTVLGLGALLGACSVLNAPGDALPTGDEPAAGGESNHPSGGKASGGSSTATAGTAQAGEGGMSTIVGVGGCGSECGGEGGAPPIGRTCDSSADDCGSTAPICDAASGECRACASDNECKTELDSQFCLLSGAAVGRCAECKKSSDCSGAKPVCGPLGSCRACNAHDDCASGICEANGSCGATETAVYALAETGVSNGTCGTIDTPCFSLATAATKLTATRNTLILVKTTGFFNTGNVALPAVKGLRVIGNGVKVHPYDGASGFTVPANANVVFSDMLIEGVTVKDGAAIKCTSGAITVNDSTLQTNSNAIVAADCDVVVTGSLIKGNDQPHVNAQAALRATCTAASCTKTTSFLRNRFVDNGVAIYLYNQAKASIENNLFLGNGADGYTRVIELRADVTHFAYNTLVKNFNSCTYVGIVACIGTCNNVANISFNNFPAESPPCYDQVWYGGTMTYNLTEVPFPGATNKTGDPKFVDAANGDFTPAAGSPALDNGNTADMPPLDYNGNKRPVGDGPDIGAIEAQ